MSRVAELLEGSSRTFALSIPMLPEPLRSEIGVAYLLFRLADTIEDEDAWDDAARLAGLGMMRDALVAAGKDGVRLPEAEAWVPTPETPLEHAGYADLFADATAVGEAFLALDAEARAIIASHLCRTLDGMIEFVQQGRMTHDLEGTLRYCYSVAGIVGELCTALFVRHEPQLQPAAEELNKLAVCYGEGLQLVNILRDALADRAASRGFLPVGVTPETLIPIAEQDLANADAYLRLLESHGASGGVRAFNTLNVRLAHDTLGLIKQGGAGVKLNRDQVGQIVREVCAATGVTG